MAALMFTACTTTTVSPSASASSTAAVSPSPSPSPAGLACKLPLAAGGAPSEGPAGGGTPGHGGFVTFPGGAFAVDAQSQGAYDRQSARWVPAAYVAVSPDGSRYAYTIIPQATGGPVAGAVHIVTVSSGNEQVAPTPGPVAVIAWTGSGIYVEAVIPQSDAPPVGLTVINPTTLGFRQITSTGFWRAVGDTYAYKVDIDPTDPNPPQQNAPGPAPGDRVERIDVGSGAVSPVLTVNGASLNVIGLDPAQNPIIGSSTASAYSVLVTPGGHQIFAGPPFDAASGGGDPLVALADATGVWFTSLSGEIWHLGPADATARAMANTGLGFPSLAGPCT
jgi:hypothetical protein